MSRKKSLIIHGHFYQPPRENPWLGFIERQDSAGPFHNWNERINLECYRANTRARVLDGKALVRDVVNNFEYLSFNIGPTLLGWLSKSDPETYTHIVEADRRSAERLGGHGNAIAQPFNHVIMPLADPQDRELQIEWAIRDFQRHFGRPPRGMWLAETAADEMTLKMLAAAGIEFTILAPTQAWKFRPIRRSAAEIAALDPPFPPFAKPVLEDGWCDVSDGSIPFWRPYRCFFEKSTDFIDVFFFEKTVSHQLAFDPGVLSSADVLFKRIEHLDIPPQTQAACVLIATDGETFGHHRPGAEMCLSHLFGDLLPSSDFRAGNPSSVLAEGPPEYEVKLKPGGTSWSCRHGVSRWNSDCGCTDGSRPGWNQKWRGPFRRALEWLNARTRAVYRSAGAKILIEPEAARKDYVGVILDRTEKNVEAFLARHMRKDARPCDALKLLEGMHNAQLMFTSCAWFFADVSGIETVQNMLYAARLIELYRGFGTENIEAGFVERLAAAKSNIPYFADGKTVWQKLVKPRVFTPEKLVNMVAVSKLVLGAVPGIDFDTYYWTELASDTVPSMGRRIEGLVRVGDRQTLDERRYLFIATMRNLKSTRSFVREVRDSDEAERLRNSVRRADEDELRREFGFHAFSWEDLGPDLASEILKSAIDESRAEIRKVLGETFKSRLHLISAMSLSRVPLSAEERAIVRCRLTEIFNGHIRGARGRFTGEVLASALETLDKARFHGVEPDLREAKKIFTDNARELLAKINARMSAENIAALSALLTIARKLELPLDYAELTGAFFRALQKIHVIDPDFAKRLSDAALDDIRAIGVSPDAFIARPPLPETNADD